MFGRHAVPQQCALSVVVQDTHSKRLAVTTNESCRSLPRAHQSSYIIAMPPAHNNFFNLPCWLRNKISILQARASRRARNSSRSPAPSIAVSDAPNRTCSQGSFFPSCPVLCRKKRKTRSDKGKKHKKPEATLHKAVVNDLEKKGVPHYGPPNGAAQMAGNYAIGTVMKKRGASAGIPDMPLLARVLRQVEEAIGDVTAGRAQRLATARPPVRSRGLEAPWLREGSTYHPPTTLKYAVHLKPTPRASSGSHVVDGRFQTNGVTLKCALFPILP